MSHNHCSRGNSVAIVCTCISVNAYLQIVHRALCARNVLVGTSMDIKIYNVGAFDLTFDSRELMKWMAPETLFDSTTTTCSDVWSFGVTLWELVTVGESTLPTPISVQYWLERIKSLLNCETHILQVVVLTPRSSLKTSTPSCTVE